jgi:hypothetical protein
MFYFCSLRKARFRRTSPAGWIKITEQHFELRAARAAQKSSDNSAASRQFRCIPLLARLVPVMQVGLPRRVFHPCLSPQVGTASLSAV